MLNGRLKDRNDNLSQGNANQILQLANQAHEKYLIRSCDKDLENAIDYYIKAIIIDPSISEAYYRLASLLWEKGEIDINSALEQCQKAITLDPNSSTARLYLGYFLKAAGRLEEAEEEFIKSIKLNRFFSAKPRIALGSTIINKISNSKPTLTGFLRGLYFSLSGIAMILWDLKVLAVFYKSLRENVNVSTYKWNGAFCKKMKKFEKAKKLYEFAAQKTGKADVFYSEIGDLSAETGKYDQAVEYYRNAIKSSPNNIVLWAKLASILQSHYQDNVKDLKDCYSHLAKLDPANPRILYELGHLYLKMEDKFKAVSAFKKAIEIDPKNAFYHNSLAYALVQLEDFDGAISEYHKAIRLNPDNEWTSIVSQALGAIYHQVNENIDAAIVSYQTAVVLDPHNIDAFIALGETYHDKNDMNNAIDSYCEAIKLDPAIPKVYCNLGLALWEKGYNEEAIIANQKAITLNPQYDIAFNNLGVVYLDGVGKLDEALVAFNQAIKHNPNYAMAYYNRGRTYQATGNKTKAAEEYQMAVDLNRITCELDEDEVQKRIYGLFSVE